MILRNEHGHLVQLRLDENEPAPCDILRRKPILEEFVVLK